MGGFPDKSDIKVRGAVGSRESAKLTHPSDGQAGLPLPALVLAESRGSC